MVGKDVAQGGWVIVRRLHLLLHPCLHCRPSIKSTKKVFSKKPIEGAEGQPFGRLPLDRTWIDLRPVFYTNSSNCMTCHSSNTMSLSRAGNLDSEGLDDLRLGPGENCGLDILQLFYPQSCTFCPQPSLFSTHPPPCAFQYFAPGYPLTTEIPMRSNDLSDP